RGRGIVPDLGIGIRALPQRRRHTAVVGRKFFLMVTAHLLHCHGEAHEGQRSEKKVPGAMRAMAVELCPFLHLISDHLKGLVIDFCFHGWYLSFQSSGDRMYAALRWPSVDVEVSTTSQDRHSRAVARGRRLALDCGTGRRTRDK